jgi:glutathione peroxidase
MKAIVLTLLLCMTLPDQSIYDFKINALDGKPVDFKNYKGKSLLLVNVASNCGYTPQYKDLQELHEKFGDKVTVLGFPANNFGGQEPGTNLQIAAFCKANYGVTFQMFEKISVKGSDQHDLYKFLSDKTRHEPTWNFCKYLVKPDGSIKFYASSVNPAEILEDL